MPNNMPPQSGSPPNLGTAGPSGFDAPIPGESLTAEPGKYPYERPPQFTDPEEILNFIFRRLTNRQAVFKTLTAMDMGIPISTLTENIIMTGAAEGMWPAHTGLLCAPAVSVMLFRMAERAHIQPRMDSKAAPVQGAPPSEIMSMARNRINSGAVDAATNEANTMHRDITTMGKVTSKPLGLAIPVNGLKGAI